MTEERVVHTHEYVANSSGTVRVKVERNSRGTNWELDASSPVPLGELHGDVGHELIATLGELDRELQTKFGSREA